MFSLALNFLPSASTQGDKFDLFMTVALTIGVVLFVATLGAAIYFSVRYRRRSVGEIAPYIPGNYLVEFLSVFGIAIWVAVFFIWGWRDYSYMITPKLDEMEINVIGQVAVAQAVLPRLRASRGRIVFEAKNSRAAKKVALAELDEAMSHRDASYAIWVVPSEEQLPARVQPLREINGDKLFVVYDPEQGPQALQLAYLLARARVLMARGAGRVHPAGLPGGRRHHAPRPGPVRGSGHRRRGRAGCCRGRLPARRPPRRASRRASRRP